jgi:hypothetical protein
VECKFEEQLSQLVSVDFMGQVSHFLGIEFAWQFHEDGHLTVNLTQQSFAETLIESLGFESMSLSTFTTSYCSGYPIDFIPHEEMSSTHRDSLCLQYQSLVGSLNWLAHTTRPDLSTVVSILVQHQRNPSSGHLDAAKYVVKYLANTITLGIYFTSQKHPILETCLHFPLAPQILSMSNANWGPRMLVSLIIPWNYLLFASHLMSTFYIDLLEPLHWLPKCQAVTAGSSAEAEIYATDECVKFLLELVQIMEFIDVQNIFMPSTNIIYNDNRASVNWSKSCTSKGLWHIQMKENRVRENIESNFIAMSHIDGRLNIADIFAKDIGHFLLLCDLFMCSHFLS